MHLKKLQLQGFKTFAERTEIEFSEGVTAVVGPNGSGKSNVADAILWVLGEQKASALRGSKAQDVIFAGSDRRKPMGMAEVSLTVDNSDGTLPVEFAEVTITRRAYRTNEGEFFLNKVPCRLKDIYELFLDTGVGREAYSLVNQNGIDAVLSANPEDRRGLFEEAAGIKKYRVKKREALRKLEATEANLLRVHDILGEIEGRLEPLRVQAERAERFQTLKERLHAIESSLLIVDLRFADYELTAVRHAREEDQSAVAKHSARIQAAEARAQGIATHLADAESKLEACRLHYQAALTQAERAESQRALAEQRAESLARAQVMLAQEMEELSGRRTRLLRQIAESEIELASIRDEEEALHVQVAERQAAAQEITRRLTELLRAGERRRQEALTLARQQAVRQAEAARAEARVTEIEAGLPALREEAVRLEASLGDLREAAAKAKTDQTIAHETLTEASRAASAALIARDSARQSAQATRAQLQASSSEMIALQTRLRTVQEIETSQEGYFAGVRAIFEAKKHGALAGDFTVVADAFQSPAGYEVAFETALAASLQDIITATENEAKAAIAYLHTHRLGRATFLPLNRMRPPRDVLDLSRVSQSRLAGMRGPALEILTFDPKFRPALEVLLGRVLVCETLEDALRASAITQGWNRIVTLTGELVLPTGALTGGRQSGRNASILGRKTEIATLQTDLKKKEQDSAQRQVSLEEAERAQEAAEEALSEAQSMQQSTQLAVSEAVRHADYAMREAKRLEETQAQMAHRLESAQSALIQAGAQAAQATANLASGGIETIVADEALAAEIAENQDLAGQRDTLQAELISSRIAFATVSERVSSLERSLRALRAEAEQVAEHQERKQRQGRDGQIEYEALVAQAALRDDERASSALAQQTAQAVLEAQTQVRQALLQESFEASAQMRTLTEARAQALEAIHKHELREARLQAQHDQLAMRLFDEYEIGVDAALALPEDPEIVSGAPQEVSRLRRELRALGEVNSGAIEEYTQVRDRHEFLTAQRADLDEARTKIFEAIKDIDASTRGVFMETFHAVGVAFDRIFTRLFGGGKTELVLTDPNDLLETGIDILVQPPGKKRQNLPLLSGGERALTAAALLFAFLEVKPSPFCVMDEVDAPLDGANVERFADLLREFGQKSQFIVITHNATTMEAAPIWYGITMQEPGISRVLSMQVPTLASDTPEPSRNGAVKV